MIKPSPTELLRSSIRSVLKNKSRTFLTSLGIIIGVTSVILLTSIGNGLKKFVSDQFDSLGSNTVFIVPGQVFNDKGGFSGQGGGGRIVSTRFKMTDISTLKHYLKGSEILPLSQTSVDVKSASSLKKNKALVGITSDYGASNNTLPSKGNGRWFTKEEEDKKSNVVILGYQIALDLFPTQNPLNKRIVIKGKTLKVIGVIDKKGSSFGGPNLDDYIFTPIGITFEFAGNQDIVQILVKAPTKESVPNVKNEIKTVLNKKYDKDAFSVFDSSQLLSSINTIISTLTVALSGIAAISLIVGGIGIMNIMLVTVTERTREIGLRKAVGAYPRAILLQFLIEAVILSGVGGLFGILLGSLGALAIRNFFPATVTAGSVALAFGVSSIVGIIFGVAPARKASQLSPIEALRYE